MLVVILTVMSFLRAWLVHRYKQTKSGEDKIGAFAYYDKLVKDLSKFDLWSREVFYIVPIKGVQKEVVYVNILTILIYATFLTFLLWEYQII